MATHMILRIVFCFWVVAFGGFNEHPAQEQDVLTPVPPEKRELLRSAVAKLIEAEKAGDWGAVFDLIEKPAGMTSTKFVKKQKGLHKLVGFIPRSVTYFSYDDKWHVRGCASFDPRSPRKGVVSSLDARWRGSRWYLTPIAIALTKEGPLEPCTLEADGGAGNAPRP